MCDSVAPLGNPVVPDVYWMLIASPGVSDSRIGASTASSACVASIDSHRSSPSSTTNSSAGQSPRTRSIMPA